LLVKKASRTRRIVARVAIAGVLAGVPAAALAVPAFADAPAAATVLSATNVDWHDHDGDHHDRDRDRDHDRDWDHHGWQGEGPGGLPPTGSAG
jgi:hypothetical protein